MPPRMEPVFSSTMKMIILGIIFVCVAIRLLPQSNPREEILRDPFLLSHTLDYNYQPDSGFRGWNTVQWRAWISQREPLHLSAATAVGRWRKNKLDAKPVNTVVIATPDEISRAFSGTLDTLRGEYVWSNRMFETYDIVRTNNLRYVVFRCPPTYIAVRLLSGKPVHFEGHHHIKVSRGNINYPRKKECVQLN